MIATLFMVVALWCSGGDTHSEFICTWWSISLQPDVEHDSTVYPLGFWGLSKNVCKALRPSLTLSKHLAVDVIFQKLGSCYFIVCLEVFEIYKVSSTGAQFNLINRDYAYQISRSGLVD
jgi:hypothetical protein